MLLEVDCTLSEYENFLNRARDAGVGFEFTIHGADENSSFRIDGQNPETDFDSKDTHLDSSSVSNEETIGKNALNEYKEGEIFMCSGQIYKATVDIYPADLLVEGGNCKKTTLNEEIQTLKN